VSAPHVFFPPSSANLPPSVCVTCITRMLVVDPNDPDLDRTLAPLPRSIVSVLELNLGIICACLPSLQRPFTILFSSTFKSPFGSRISSYRLSRSGKWTPPRPEAETSTQVTAMSLQASRVNLTVPDATFPDGRGRAASERTASSQFDMELLSALRGHMEYPTDILVTQSVDIERTPNQDMDKDLEMGRPR
jgi:hypothetical protein